MTGIFLQSGATFALRLYQINYDFTLIREYKDIHFNTCIANSLCDYMIYDLETIMFKIFLVRELFTNYSTRESVEPMDAPQINALHIS